MKYYGVRYARDCHPSDLFVTYFTSSDYVTDYINEHGLPDIVEVRRKFASGATTEAITWEHNVLQRIRARTRDDYLNKNDGKAILPLSPDIERQRVENITKTKNSPEVKEKTSGLNWWKTDKTIYTFVHKDGRVEKCTRIELCNKYNLNRGKLSRIINRVSPDLKSHRGWMIENTEYCDRTGKNRYNYDYTIYSFIHDSGIIEHCTRHELYTKYELIPAKIMLVIRGDRSHHKGWRLYHTKKN